MLPWLLIADARAHEIGLSTVRIERDALTVVFARGEVDASFPIRPTLTVDGEPCALGDPVARDVEEDGRAFTMSLSCPDGASFSLDAPWLADLGRSHRAMVEWQDAPVGMMTASHPRLTWGEASSGEVAADFIGLGVEHVLTGFDHLAFLLGLLLVARSTREIVGVVTGFTLAHSLTLSLAALGVFSLPGSFVEPAIALSVAWVGLENRWNPPPGRRLALTFALGLIHGFGFAGLLAELGLPVEHRALALVSFNVGVELGQLALVALALPVLLALRRREGWVERGVPAISLGLVAIGLFWFAERVFFG